MPPGRDGARAVAGTWLTSSAVRLGVTALLVSTLWASVTLLPLDHRVHESFTIWGVTPNGCGTTNSFSVPVSGYFDFTWRANTTAYASLYLYGVGADDIGTYQPYSQVGLNGTGNVSVYPGFDYYLEFCGGWNQTAVGGGLLSFEAPLVRQL